MAKIKPDPVAIRSGAVTVGDFERFLALCCDPGGHRDERRLAAFQKATGLPERQYMHVLNDDEQETTT